MTISTFEFNEVQIGLVSINLNDSLKITLKPKQQSIAHANVLVFGYENNQIAHNDWNLKICTRQTSQIIYSSRIEIEGILISLWMFLL